MNETEVQVSPAVSEAEVESLNLGQLMETAYLANGTLMKALKDAGVTRAERRRAMRLVTKGFGIIEGR